MSSIDTLTANTSLAANSQSRHQFHSPKIHREHYRRKAVVYVRQSTPQQVLQHTESTDRQYALVDRAAALGWPRSAIEIIDEDQGHSGSSAMDRNGFQRLLSEISADQIGLVLGLEMSRLARSCKDWHVLLEVCALYRTLLADTDGVYDPAEHNDRLLLGLKGTMSEAELHVLKSRLDQGRWNKARRGELLSLPPIGYVRTLGGDFQLDPDQQVQSVVRLLFAEFSRQNSVSGLLRWLVASQVQLPFRSYSGETRGELQWRVPSRVTLTNLLRHPLYAGAYRFGYRQVDPRRKIPGRPGTGRTRQSPQKPPILIQDRFPAYISWEQFEQNQRQLDANRVQGPFLSAPRRGPSLLAGLVICGRCGQRMLVSYGQSADRKGLRYSCDRANIDYAAPRCQNLAGAVLDTFVEKQILRVVSAASLELSLAAGEDILKQRQELESHWQQRLEQADYEVQLARRQYEAVDPEHRLVARELEDRWEQTLENREQLGGEYVRFQQQTPVPLSAGERNLILQLCADLPALWQADSTTAEDRQQIVRLLLEQAVVTVEEDTEQMEVALTWAGGFLSRELLARPVNTYQQLSYYQELVERIASLREAGETLAGIARNLNEEGFRPPKRARQFSRDMVSKLLQELRRKQGTHSDDKESSLVKNEWWLADLAMELEMPVATLHRWRKAGWLQCRKVNVKNGRWVVFANAEELDRLHRLRESPSPGVEGYPSDLTTPSSASHESPPNRETDCL